MKRNAVIASTVLLLSFTLSACAPAAPGGQTSEVPSVTTETPGYGDTSTPEFLNDIGKTLRELKTEHPQGESMVSLDGFPDSAAACFEDPEADYAYYFFETQSGDAEKAMSECEDQLRCAGLITTADTLFPDMEDTMSFQDFFTLIGVDDYEYLTGEDVISGAGWLSFTYHDMEVMVNTNEAADGGGWTFTGAEIVRGDAPVSIADPETATANQDLADGVMFDETVS